MRKSDSIFAANWGLLLALALLWPAGWVVQDSGWFDSYTVRILMLIGIRIAAAVSLQLINGISGQFSLGHAGFMAIGAYFAAYPAIHYSASLSQPAAPAAFYVALACVLALGFGVLYAIYRAMLLTRRLFGAAPAVLALLLLLSVIADIATAGENPSAWHAWSWAIIGIRWLFGAVLETLLPLGGHMYALLPSAITEHLPTGLWPILSMVVLLLGGGLCAAGAGLAVGIPSLRLRGDYLAIATLGFAEIVRVLLEASDAMGGALGLTGIPQVTGFAWVYGLVIVTIAAVWRLVRSARGRAMLAVREDEIAAAAVGIDPARSKIMAFLIGAFLAGMAGAMLAHYEGYITPGNFAFMQSIELVVIVTLAGAGSITGTVIVAALLTWLPEQLRLFSDYRMIVYSLVLIVMMLLRPNGILGNRELPDLFRRKPREATA